uniref:PALM2 and AKAP2 fusion n=1 Tax=Mastacembelus armatus TaxID=205130 RepID=A0A3Q3L3N1_9TELE
MLLNRSSDSLLSISNYTSFECVLLQKSCQAVEDVSDTIPRERALKSVSFQESVSVITDRLATMELESQQNQHGCLSSPSNQAHNAVDVKTETPDSEVVQEIRYLDQVLDAASETSTNGNSSPSDHAKPITIDGTSPSVRVPASSPVSHQSITVEGQRQTTFLHKEDSALRTNGHVQEDDNRPRFELRAFQEEKRPAKLFSPGEEQQVRVTRRRPSEEVQELERERQELIRDQAVKKNPGIAQRWWNPPQEVPLEEQLEAEQLQSLRKYQERKQQRQTHTYTYTQPQLSGPPTVVTFDPALTRKEDIVEEQIDFSSARKQFLQGNGAKKDVAPQIYSAKPFSKSLTKSSDIVAEPGESHVTWSNEGIVGEFTSARAVMTILPEEEEGKGHFHSPFHPEESDSGLDELSVRSQDTTVFSLDNVSDSGASLPPTPLPLTPVSPPTPQPTTPVNGQTSNSPTEDELEYHAGVLVQNAIQNALAAQDGGDWQPSDLSSTQLSTPVSPSSASTSSPVPVSSSPVSAGGAPSFQSPLSSSPAPSNLSPQPDRQPEVEVVSQEKLSESQQAQLQSSSPAQPPQLQTPSPPTSQPVSPQQRPKDRGPRIKIQSSYARALASSSPAPAPAPTPAAPVTRPAPVYRPPSPPSPEKPEFSYFSKYSEAAELRSTAVATRGPEPEAASGPFRLRSKKQRTLSMIEEEIRAAQQREDELKKQREAQPAVIARPSSTHGPVRTGLRQTTITPADKMKSNSLPSRLTLTARTAPG